MHTRAPLPCTLLPRGLKRSAQLPFCTSAKLTAILWRTSPPSQRTNRGSSRATPTIPTYPAAKTREFVVLGSNELTNMTSFLCGCKFATGNITTIIPALFLSLPAFLFTFSNFIQALFGSRASLHRHLIILATPREGIKTIIVARNPKDTCVSLWHHAREKPEFNAHGGAPRPGTDDPPAPVPVVWIYLRAQMHCT